MGEVIRECQHDWPFEINALVLLPDHLHALWTLPPGDTNYSARWSVIKKNFTSRFLRAGGQSWAVSRGKQRENRQGVWQRRFWEHTIEDEEDFETHFDYLHYNPVKHSLVKCPHEWQPSSFHRWVKLGGSPPDWARTAPPLFAKSLVDFGEPD
jgi:putative transposase